MNNSSNQRSNRKGFTLAEVLITLGIIGIVAEITIPTLMKNIQEAQFKTAALKAYSLSAQVILSMKSDNGGTLSTYYNTGWTFKTDFMKYFKVAQDCNWDDCVPQVANSTQYSTLTGNPANTGSGGEGQFVTTDGMFYNIQNSGAGLIEILVDVNGYGKKPNKFGKDSFVFQLLNDKLVPMGFPNTEVQPPEDYCNKTSSSNANGFTCFYYVIQGANY